MKLTSKLLLKVPKAKLQLLTKWFGFHSILETEKRIENVCYC